MLEKRWLYLRKAPAYFWTDALFGVWLGLGLIFVAVAMVSKEVWRRVPGVFLICVIAYFAVVSSGT